MREYQYYEFQAVDRPLTRDEQAKVSALSSRVELSATRAVFTYSYSSFRGRPLDVLASYYDAYLYVANWGSRELAFRFPRSVVDYQRLAPYYFGIDEIELTKTDTHVILDIAFNDEEPPDWVEGEGILDSLVPLREDILHGDLRVLYLAWLNNTIANIER